jgi:DNA-directed RNA polymerase subunit RPC12/RpoP
MQRARFVKNNRGFKCLVCGAAVPAHPTSSRDHCPACLYSVHVDINPGDRENPCRGLLEPVGFEIKRGKKRILYKCTSCRAQIVNEVAPDDDFEKVMSLAGFDKPLDWGS